MEQSDGKMVGRWYHIRRWTDSCVQETQWDGGAECAGRSDGSGEWIEKLQEWKLYWDCTTAGSAGRGRSGFRKDAAGYGMVK